MIDEHRLLYNHCLAKKSTTYKESKINISCFDLIKTEIKKLRECGQIKISNYSSCQQTIRRLDKSYQVFFKKGGFPRFKAFERFNTVEYGVRGDGNQIKGSKLYLQNIGLIKCLWFLELKDYKTLSITRRGDKFFANFIIESVFKEKTAPSNKQIGIDFGLLNYITTSDGQIIDSPKFHKKSLKELAKIHRRIHKCEKKSKARQKHKKTLAKIYEKIQNRRKDFNHKISRRLVNNHDLIVCEDIRLQKLMQSDISNINRTYADVAFGQFINFLSYKAEIAGKTFLKINPAYTTQECSRCKQLTKLSLKERTFCCNYCSHTENRDINAAKNILRRGLASFVKLKG